MTGVLTALAVMVAAGAPAALGRRLTTTGLAFLYGAGVVFVSLEAVSLAGFPWTTVSVLATCAAAALAGGFVLRRSSMAAVGEGAVRPAAPDLLTVLLLAVFALFATGAAPWHWDFWALWGLKGRVFFEHGGIDWSFLRSEWNAFAHADYPQLVPLLLAFPAVLTGHWSDRWLGLVFVAFAAALALVVRQLTSRELPARQSSAIALALTGAAASEYVGLAEIPFIALSTAGLLFVRRAGSGDESAWLPGAVLLGLAASAKNEGLSLLLSVAVVMALLGSWRSIVRLWPALAIAAPWLVARATAGLPGVYLAAGSPLERALGQVPHLPSLAVLLVTGLDKPLCWMAILLALPFALRRERFLFGVVGVQLVFFVGAFLITPFDLTWHAANSWDRLSRQLLAPAAYAALVPLAAAFAAARRENAEARSEQ